MRGDIPESFSCFACGRKYRWREEIAGKSLRCKCGEKIRVPTSSEDTVTGKPSMEDTVQTPLTETLGGSGTEIGLGGLNQDNDVPTMTFDADESGDGEGDMEDTVADVELGEHLDQMEAEEERGVTEKSDELVEYRRVPQKGIFGKPIGFEVALFGLLSLVGVVCAIMAAFLWKYWMWWIGLAVLIGPYSWYRLHRAWPRWMQGRSWFEIVGEMLGEHDEAEAARSSRPR